MKLLARIEESPEPDNNSVIVKFIDDKKNQHFEVKCSFNPYYYKMRKWEVWEFDIKWESEIFTEPKSGAKSYFTHLTCSKADVTPGFKLKDK